jgi:hypothetical protein
VNVNIDVRRTVGGVRLFIRTPTDPRWSVSRPLRKRRRICSLLYAGGQHPWPLATGVRNPDVLSLSRRDGWCNIVEVGSVILRGPTISVVTSSSRPNHYKTRQRSARLLVRTECPPTSSWYFGNCVSLQLMGTAHGERITEE